MKSRRNPAWAELVQLLPVLSLAFPFILEGKVNLARAGGGFLLGALLSIPISALVLRAGHLLNPILVATDLWLCVGALAFNLSIEPLAAWLASTQAFGLFVAVLGVGLLTTLFSAHGYIGVRSQDSRWLRWASLCLLALTFAVVGWAWLLRSNIRLGGGLPFIVLNVARRALGLRAPTSQATAL